MYTLRLHRIILQQLVFLLQKLLRSQLLVLQIGNLGPHVGKNEKRGIFKTG